MASTGNRAPQVGDQFGGAESSASSIRLEGSRSTTKGLTISQGSAETSINHLNTSERSTEAILPGAFQPNGLHHRHRYGVEDKNSASEIDNATSQESNSSNKFHNMHVAEDSNDTGGDTDSLDTTFSESTIVPRRNLGFIQITSLMLNSTIGSGPFVTPGYVLALTCSKPIALVLWAFGGVYTALSMLVYLEFGTALPYNGGALIYLDEMFHYPRLLATVLFSVFWIIKAGTYSNSRNVALYTLAVANPNTPVSDISDGLVRYTAVIVQTVVCLLLYFMRRLCFVFNSGFALYKIVLLLFIFIAGMANIRGPNSGMDDFNEKHSGYTSANALNAMLAIVYSYEGWDGANYVAGEIKDAKNTLRWAAVTTVLILTVTQMLATFAFYAVFDYDTLTSDDGQDNIALVFAQRIFGTQRGMEVAVCLSDFAQLLFETYTTAKVKQAIAWQRIIPFYKFFGRQDPQFDSPGGGLVLHWFFTVLTLLIFQSKSDARSFYSGIYSYGYAVIGLFLGIGLLRLKSRMQMLNDNWKPTYLTNQLSVVFISFVFISINIIILVMTALPTGGAVPNYYWPVTIVGFIAFGIVYWGVLRLLGAKDPNPNGRRTLGSKLGLEADIYEEGDDYPEDMKFLMREAFLDGGKRRVQYKVSGPLLRCKQGYIKAKTFIFTHFGYGEPKPVLQ